MLDSFVSLAALVRGQIAIFEALPTGTFASQLQALKEVLPQLEEEESWFDREEEEVLDDGDSRESTHPPDDEEAEEESWADIGCCPHCHSTACDGACLG